MSEISYVQVLSRVHYKSEMSPESVAFEEMTTKRSDGHWYEVRTRYILEPLKREYYEEFY